MTVVVPFKFDSNSAKKNYRVGQKNGATDSRPQLYQILTDLKKFTGRFLGKFAVKRILKFPPHLAYVATLPCETLMSAKTSS